MIDFSVGTYSCTCGRGLRQLGLPLLISFFCTFFSAQVAKASPAVIEVNSSGSLLGEPTGGVVSPSSIGALTMNSFDVYAPAFERGQTITIPTTWERASLTEPETKTERQTSSFASYDQERSTQYLVAQDETVAFGEVTPVPKLSTWVAGMLAAGALLFSARSRCGSRSLNT